MGLEPTRHRHTHLKRACLPIPALPQIAFDCKKDSSTFGGIKSSPILYLFSCPIKQPLQPFLSFITVILTRKPFVGAVFAPTALIWLCVGGGVAGSRSDQFPSGALNRTSGPALLDGGHRFGRQTPTPRQLRAPYGRIWNPPLRMGRGAAVTAKTTGPRRPHPRSGYPRLRGHRR